MVKAVISLTSWKKRIQLVPNTIRSLLNDNFHIVLVLSEDEFPERNVDLPQQDVEILWVKGNPKSFKKVLYTMKRYPDLPVISVDDDAIYADGFADDMYAMYMKYPHSVISNFPNVKTGGIRLPNGYCTLYPAHCMDGALEALTGPIIATNNDDGFYGVWLTMKNIDFRYLMRRDVAVFCDDGNGMGVNQLYKAGNADIKIIISELKKQGKLYSDNELLMKKWGYKV